MRRWARERSAGKRQGDTRGDGESLAVGDSADRGAWKTKAAVNDRTPPPVRGKRGSPLSQESGWASKHRLALAFLVAVAVGGVSAFLVSRRAAAQNDPAPAGTGAASNADLEIAVRAGFGRLEVNNWSGAWVPFRVTISNQGPAVAGRLVIHTESSNGPNSQAREFVKEVQLPTGAHQLHEIAAFLSSSENPAVRLVSGDRILIETSVQMQRNWGSNDQLDFGVVDTDPTALNNISQTQIQQQPNREPFKLGPRSTPAQASNPNVLPGAPSGPSGRRGPRNFGSGPQAYSARPIVVAPEDLPRDFVGYDVLDALVINEAPLSQLTEDQARALRLWVASGGLLIVTGGADVPGMRVNRLDEILPVEPGGAASAAGFAAGELAQIYGAFETADVTPGISARLKTGARAILGPPERPIVAERTYGNGLVRFVAINPKINPYRAWNGAKELWADLLWPAADAKPRHGNWITMGGRGPSRAGRFGIQDFLFHLAEVQPPSAKYVIVFLLAYVLLVGPINYAILRWRRKTDLAWLTIPAVVLVFTLVSVTVAQMSHGGKSVIADASLVQAYQAEGLTSLTSGVIVVPSAKDVQELSFPGGSGYATDVFNGNQGGSASSAGAIVGQREPKEYLLRAPLTARMASLFQFRTVREAEPPILSMKPSSGAVSLKNLGDSQIVKAVYLSAEGISDVFDLDSGSEQRVVLNNPSPQAFNAWYVQQLGDGDELELFEDLASVLDREVGGDRAITNGFFETQAMSDALRRLGRPLVVGFIEKAPSEIGFRSTFKRSSRALYVIHL